MIARRISVLAVGLAFFVAVAALAGMMALALGPSHPLMALWTVVPAPLVFSGLVLLRPRHRSVRIMSIAYLVVGALLTILFWGSGWLVSEQLREGALARDETPTKYDQEVVALGPDTATLRAMPEAKENGPWTMGGTWGLEGASAYYQATSGERHDREVVWELHRLKGNLKVGDRMRLDTRFWPPDLPQTFPAPLREVTYTSPLGQFRAWMLEGTGDTWVIFVHGRGAEPHQGLRLVPVLSELKLPALLITYRNDEDMPLPPDGFYRYGQTEWEDLEDAVKYALDNGAKRVVLAGWSMGGAIVVNFLYRSPVAQQVEAVILDAPMMNFNATVDFGARQRGIPQLQVVVGKAVSRYRFGVDWPALDYLRDVNRLSVPVLLIHGGSDDTVPIETSEALARARPDIVKYVTFPGAQHVTSWNLDPRRYDDTLRQFLEGVLK